MVESSTVIKRRTSRLSSLLPTKAIWRYIRTNPSPSRELRARWIRPLVDAFSYVRSCRVVVHDVALRNILVHNDFLKLCDFGGSSLLPLYTNMEHFYVSGTAPQIEILYVGCVFYSVAVWQVFEYDYDENERFPKVDELPVTEGVLVGNIVNKCWNGEYASMEALRRDVHDFAE